MELGKYKGIEDMPCVVCHIGFAVIHLVILINYYLSMGVVDGLSM